MVWVDKGWWVGGQWVGRSAGTGSFSLTSVPMLTYTASWYVRYRVSALHLSVGGRSLMHSVGTKRRCHGHASRRFGKLLSVQYSKQVGSRSLSCSLHGARPYLSYSPLRPRFSSFFSSIKHSQSNKHLEISLQPLNPPSPCRYSSCRRA